MRILVSGTRRARTDVHQHTIADALQLAAWGSTRLPGPHVLVYGDAPGVEQHAARLAYGWGWTVEPYPAGDTAAVVAAGVDLVLAFPSTAGESEGTWDLVQRAAAAGLRVNIRPLRCEADRGA